ncbi:dihydroorotase [Litorimonas cladophorae]|uniref:Dihydroorotase n=1 Tax=Litorimonas cladophorae TaxID=1220491 RepID=A0A918KAN5_9PROT|nr:dihydroorotase [Litorimonas cladophorae]GGX55636.1 dihydroorotase [Litorimonas cladophorae]
MTQTLTLRRPDDWHVHLRDGAMLADVVNHTARQFARAIVMPNLKPPVTTVEMGRAYRERILAAVDPSLDFTPLMVAYLTDTMDPEVMRRGKNEGVFTAAKLYPANATTNSSHGVTDIKNIHEVLDAMEDVGMPLLVHGEVTHKDVDIFDREAVFIDEVMVGLVKEHPNLKVVFEHITTQEAADFVTEAGENVAATITPHHLRYNRNAIFEGGIRPHYYCLPIAKREKHRLALRKAATSGSSKFFLGTDTAPHAVGAKESACGCAGVFNAPFAMESYALTFEEENALDQLEKFASINGPRFYGLPLNEGKMTLTKRDQLVPERITLSETDIIPFHAGETLGWSVS